MKPLRKLIIALALFGLSASAANAQTIWNIGYPNEADLTATLSEFTYYGYSLTISGNGAMKDFTAGTAPWYNVGTVYNLDIQPGVTTIGNYAFYNVSGLMSDLIIPNTVTSIGASAFENCSYMWAFNNSKVVIPNSVVSIGSYAFKNCCFGIFDVDNANPSYTSDDGVLFDKGKTTLISCLSAKSGDYIVPNTITSIENYACYNCCLSSVTIPNSVTSIGDYAFYQKDGSSGYHPGLTLVSLSDGLTRIGYAAFEYCKFNYIRLPKSLTSLASHAFGNCSNLKTVDVDRDTPLAITSDVFAGMNLSQCTLIVPSGKTALYKAADVWKNFGTFVERVPITGVTLNRTSATITGVGLTLQLTATIAPTNATFQNIIWTSSNPKVATVSDSGLVTSIATGTVIITVTTQDGGYSASCTTSVQYGDGTITDIYLDTYGLRGPNSSSKTIEGFKNPIYCTDFSNGPFKIRVNYSATAPTKTIKIALCVPKKEFAESFATNCYFYDSSQSYLTGSDGGHRFPGLDELEKIKEFVIEANKTTDNVLLLWDAKTDPAFTNGISYPVKDDVWILVTDAKTGEVLQFEPQRWTHVNRLRGGYAFTYTQKANSVVCDIYFTSQIPIKKAVPFIGDDCTFSNADFSQIKKGGVEKIVLSMLYPLEPRSMEINAYKVFDNLSPDENGIYHLSWEIKDLQGNYFDIEKYKYVYEGGYTSYYADFGLYVEGYEQETYGLKLPEYGGKYHGSGDYVSILYGTTFPGLLNPNATYPEFDIENGVLLHYHGSGGNVIVPNTVTKISDLAFYKHTAIQTITIPASVTSIDEFAFLNCSGITSFTVAAENQNYCSEAGVIYNKNKTVLVQYPRAKSRTPDLQTLNQSFTVQ